MPNQDVQCPGRYCGRLNLSGSEGELKWSECSACPAGYRASKAKYCTPCEDNPTLYQWMYLGFMAMLPILLHWFYIFIIHKRWKKAAYLQFLSALIETSVAVLASLLVFEPRSSLNLTSCGVMELSDWYTVFYNPKIKYTKTLYCAQEAVFPLYSIVFVCYLFSLVLMLILRLLWTYRFVEQGIERKQSKRAIYAALYFHPILLLAHAATAGLLYYSYPYILSFVTVTTFVTYCIQRKLKTFNDFLNEDKYQHLIVVFGHLFFLAYAVISVIATYFDTVVKNLHYLCAVPAPFIFFFLTEKLTDPNSIKREITLS